MPGVHRQGDYTKGHGCWPPTVPDSYSDNVFVNGRKVVRQGDAIVPHTCPPTHGGTYQGTHDVYVNSRPIQTCGDPVSCGDSAGTCSGDVFVN